MVTFSLVVVRHGATDANEQGIMQGQSDFQLNELGRHQALLLGRHFRQCPHFSSFTHYYASDLARAKETAEIIRNALGDNDAEQTETDDKAKLIFDCRLRERLYGVLEGKHWTVQRDEAKKTNVSPAEYTPEDGETLRELYTRVSAFFRDLVSQVVAVSYACSSNTASLGDAASPSKSDDRQQRHVASSNRNNRVHVSGSKIRRRSSLVPLVPLPELPATAITTAAAAATAFETVSLTSAPEDGQTMVDKRYQQSTSTGNVIPIETSEESRDSVVAEADDQGTVAVPQPGREAFSPYSSSGDSGISTVSNQSLFINTLQAPATDDIRMKRTHSASSSPGLTLLDECTPRNSSDTSEPEQAWDRAQRYSSSLNPTVNWGYRGASDGRKMSVQSITSDDGNIPELDAQILVITHGGTIRELFRYFVDELGCVMVGGKGAALRPCPNTAVSTFMVNVNVDDETAQSIAQSQTNSGSNIIQEKDVSVICLGLHSKEHLNWDSSPTTSADVPQHVENVVNGCGKEKATEENSCTVSPAVT